MKWGIVAILVLLVSVGTFSVIGALPPPVQRGPTSRPQIKLPGRIDVSVEMPAHFDPAKPVVVVRYTCETADDPVDIYLPKDDESMPYFAQFIVVRADDVKLATQIPGAVEVDVLFGPKRTLKPGESTAIVAPLNKIFSVPEKWKVLEIVPTKGRVSGVGYIGSLRIVNEGGESPSAANAGTRP